MFHYRDARAGKYYLNNEDSLPISPNQDPPFLRFSRKQGVGLDLWNGEGGTAVDLLGGAGLDWRVHGREVLVPARPRRDCEPDLFASRRPGLAEARGYRALVRPDTDEIMSVVTSAYRVAENRWVAEALEDLSSRLEQGPPVIAATSFGREHERTLFVGRVTATPDDALCLLVYNTHGGEGAVRFQLAECSRRTGTTYVLDSEHATMSIPHVGDLEDRLGRASSPDQEETFVERYVVETQPLWDRLSESLWTRRHTAALIKDLWGEAPTYTVDGPTGRPDTRSVEYRHPGHHLPARMQDTNDAAGAYRAVCDWIDNRSEACERGDFTKDRDERLALGAGNRYKRAAWRWILDNT